jgi:hypothetical protein
MLDNFAPLPTTLEERIGWWLFGVYDKDMKVCRSVGLVRFCSCRREEEVTSVVSKKASSCFSPNISP